MLITHRSSTALSKSSLNFGLKSFLLCSSRLMAKILKQIRLSASQWLRFLLNRFYPNQDDFSVWNRISDFQRTKKTKIQCDSTAVNALYLGRERLRVLRRV